MIERKVCLQWAFWCLILLTIGSATLWVHSDLQKARQEGVEARTLILHDLQARHDDHVRMDRRMRRIETKLDRLLDKEGPRP